MTDFLDALDRRIEAAFDAYRRVESAWSGKVLAEQRLLFAQRELESKLRSRGIDLDLTNRAWKRKAGLSSLERHGRAITDLCQARNKALIRL